MLLKTFSPWLCCGVLALACNGSAAADANGEAAARARRVVISTLNQPDASTQARVRADYGALPLAFELNRGQSDAAVKYLARGPGYELFLTESEAVLALQRGRPDTAKSQQERNLTTASPAVLRMRLLGIRSSPRIDADDELPGKVNYFRGNDATQWNTGLPTFAKVRYRNVYPGIDLVYYGNQGKLEYDLVLAPGADPGAIALAFDGADSLRLNDAGDLLVKLGDQEIVQKAPAVYQLSGGRRKHIPAVYVLADNGQVRVNVGAYDRNQALVVDPVLVYSTYFGASAFESGNAMAVDRQGNLYLAGETASADFPGVALSNPAFGGGVNHVFVAKLNPAGSALLYASYFGGNSFDIAAGIAVDGAGNAYVAGRTYSTNFPVVNAIQSTQGGSDDAFVAKLDADGSSLVYATYFGGSGADRARGIAVDGDGNAYVSGYTASTNLQTRNALQSTFGGGGSDGFVAKLDASGSTLVYSTYLGGGADDVANGISVDTAGNAYVTGSTGSSNFPIRNAMNAMLKGGSDAFVTKFNAAGTALIFSTYLGGNGGDSGAGIAIDGVDNVYVAGQTTSTDLATANALQTQRGGGTFDTDAFVARLNAAGTALTYATYLGGNREDVALGIAVDGAGDAYVAGHTYPSISPPSFPTTPDALQPTLSYLYAYDSGFVSKIDPTGSKLLYSTFLAGTMYYTYEGYNIANAVAVDNAGNFYVTGNTQSTNFPVQNALQPEFAGMYDAFITKFAGAVAPPILRADSDVDGDGRPDLAVLTAGGQKVTVKSQTGQLISEVAFDKAGRPVAFQTLANFGGTQAPELALLGAGGVAEVRDALSGELLDTVSFDPQLTPIDLAVLDDFNGNGVPELAMLGVNSAGAGTVEVRDAATGIRLTSFNYASVLQPKNLVVTDDLTGDGQRELGMLGENVKPSGSDRIEVRNPFTGVRVVNLWQGSGFTMDRARRVGDLTGDGIGEVATVRTKPDQVNVLIDNPVNGATVTALSFAARFRPVDLVSIADFTHNGACEIGLLSHNEDTGAQRMDIVDSRSKKLLRRLWFTTDFLVQGADVLPDRDGNGAEEVAVLGRRESDGAMNVYIKDAASGALLKRIAF